MNIESRLSLTSLSLAEARLAKLKELVPEAFTEGRVDFEKLRQALGESVETGRERYGLGWAGRSAAVRTLMAPGTGTLRPCPEESVNFDTTENLIIEGDNLEVLKLLQKSYYGKVKLIYIDPPYNTANDFIYADDFRDTLKAYQRYTGQIDEAGNATSSEQDRSGRVHSNWLSMMYPRLHLARNLLRENGVIFISIDDLEASSLKILLDEIFGEECHVATFIWNNEGNIDNQSKIKISHEYIFCYERSEGGFKKPSVIDPNIEETSKLFNERIENSITKNGPANPPSMVTLPAGFPAADDEFSVPRRSDAWPKILDDLYVRGGKLLKPARLESGWSSRNLLDLFIDNGFVPINDGEGKETSFAVTRTGAIYIYKKRQENQGHVLSVIRNVGTTKQNGNMLGEWGLSFPYPKPLKLIKYLCEIASVGNGDICLDFFAGSGTTAHAVLALNGADGIDRKFILVQLPEPAGNAAYPTIAHMTRERVRQAISRISQEHEEVSAQPTLLEPV